MHERPFSQAAENNKTPIRDVLLTHCSTPGELLEIGAGTGQHAAWLAGQLPHLRWQPSDVPEHLRTIQAWLTETQSPALPPIALDVNDTWPQRDFDYLFTANTFHIMPAPFVSRCIQAGCQRLRQSGRFLIYGPFNYDGKYTSDSNARFDEWLKEANAERGIRDQEWVVEQFAEQGFRLKADHAMPANNRMLVFSRDGE